MITKEQLAARLTGRQYGHEITREEEAEAKAAGLLVLFGYSDDNIELRGVFHDEVGVYCGSHPAVVVVTSSGLLESWDEGDEKSKTKARAWFKMENLPRTNVRAKYGNLGDFDWVIQPDVAHAAFEILEDGDKFCRGAVVSVADFKAPSP